MKQVDAFGSEVGWHKVDDIFPAEWSSFEDALKVSGFQSSDLYGQRDGYGIEVFQNKDGLRIACVQTPNTWHPVILPDLPALLEFMRLYWPSMVQGPMIADLAVEAYDVIGLLKEYGPLLDMVEERERRYAPRGTK